MDNDGQQAKQGGPPPPPPPAPNDGPDGQRPETADQLRQRLDRAEAQIAELQRRAADSEEALRAATPDARQGGETLAAGVDALRGRASREEELAARVALAESSLSDLKAAFDGQRVRLEGELDGVAQKDSVEALRVNLAAALSALEGMKLNFSQYSDELAASRSECRKALGEAQGLARVAAQGQASGQLDEFVRESVSKLGARLAELETAMHAGLSELSARFTANEVLYGKMFASAEERLKKGLEPQLKNVEGQLRWLRENLLKLSDDYTVVAERKMKALEAKYSAFETISRRMDAIDAALRMVAKKGSD